MQRPKHAQSRLPKPTRLADLIGQKRRRGASRMVRVEGLEPTHLAALEPKSSASTNSATLALGNLKLYPNYQFRRAQDQPALL
jgi:hypothetical protein